MAKAARTRFLNVDLEIFSSASLRKLAADFETLGGMTIHVGRLGNGEHLASIELSGRTRGVESTVRGLLKLVHALPASSHSQWKKARRRVFNIGIEAEHGAPVFAAALRPETLRGLAAADAEVELTVYAPSEK